MRRSLLVAILLGLSASAFAADVSFVHVWPQWRGADAFDRIREYFGGAENDGSDLVVRTHPDQRAGLYFLVRVKATTEVGRATFVLDVIRPDAPQPRRFTFPVTLRSKSQVAELGLTAEDWPGGRAAHPVAWKLTLVAPDGRVLATEQSFLWEKPAS